MRLWNMKPSSFPRDLSDYSMDSRPHHRMSPPKPSVESYKFHPRKGFDRHFCFASLVRISFFSSASSETLLPLGVLTGCRACDPLAQTALVKPPCLSIGCLTTRDIQLPRPSAVNDFLVNLALRLVCIDTIHDRDTDSDSFMNGLGVFPWLSTVIRRNTTIINHSLSYGSLHSELDHPSCTLMQAPGERNHTPAA